MKIPFETFISPICRGAVEFRTDCGTCEKCLWLKKNANKPELFKVTKTGFYRVRDGGLALVLNIEYTGAMHSGDLVSGAMIMQSWGHPIIDHQLWLRDGIYADNRMPNKRDLVEYLGETLPEELRKESKEVSYEVIEKISMEQEDMAIELLARELYDTLEGTLDFEQVKTLAKEAYIKNRNEVFKKDVECILNGESIKKPVGLLGAKK